MERLGRELDSRQHWDEEGRTYAGALENDYHVHRLSVISRLIPAELFAPNRRIFDFGCGDAIHLPSFLEAGAQIEGADISSEMITLARTRLVDAGYNENLVKVADVDCLREIPSESLDALLSFNVLAYLNDDEEKLFYQEARRIVKQGGYLVVTHSNELFDMFSLNRFTVEFFKRHFVIDDSYRARLDSLLAAANFPETPTAYNIRENPLLYRNKLAGFGFCEVKQEFINWHLAPPTVLLGNKCYPNTIDVNPEEKWKLMFVCSTYGSCAERKN